MAFGRTAKSEFFVETKDLIAANKLYQSLGSMSHNIVPFNPSNAGKAVNYAVSRSTPEVTGQESNYVVLLYGRDSYDDVVEAIQNAKSQNVAVITFYIGDFPLPREQMDLLSTMNYGAVPARRLYDLKGLEYEILELICAEEPVETVPMTTTPSPPVPTMPCKLDIAVVIDDLYLGHPKSAMFLRKFLLELSGSILIGPDQANVVIATTGKKTRVITGMVTTKVAFDDAVNTIKPRTQSGPINYAASLDFTTNYLINNGRNEEGVHKVVMFVARRKPKKERLLTVGVLEDALVNGVEVISVVTDDAHFINNKKLSNIGRFVKAKRFVTVYCVMLLLNRVKFYVYCTRSFFQMMIDFSFQYIF